MQDNLHTLTQHLIVHLILLKNPMSNEKSCTGDVQPATQHFRKGEKKCQVMKNENGENHYLSWAVTSSDQIVIVTPQ